MEAIKEQQLDVILRTTNTTVTKGIVTKYVWCTK